MSCNGPRRIKSNSYSRTFQAPHQPVVYCPTWHWWDHTWSIMSRSGLLNRSKTWTYWTQPTERLYISLLKKGQESCLKAEAGFHQCVQISEGGGEKNGVRLFLVAFSDWTSGHGHRLKHRSFCLNIWKHFLLCGWLSTGTGCLGMLWSLHTWQFANTIWTWIWAATSKWAYLCRGVEPKDLQKFCTTWAILYFCYYHLATAYCRY